MVMSAAGIQSVPMTSEELKLAKVETDPTAYWTAEGADITESEGTFGALKLRARALAVYSEASLELMRDASNAAQLVEQSIAKALAAKLDSTCLNGPAGTRSRPNTALESPRMHLLPGAGILLEHAVTAHGLQHPR